MSNKTSISTGYLNAHFSRLETLDFAKEAGAAAVDFDLAGFDYRRPDSIYAKSPEEFTEFFKSVKQRADKNGIVICQTHGRRDPFFEKDDEYNNTVFQKNAELDLKASKILGAPFCVFHPGGTLSNMSATPEEMRANAVHAFKSILPFAKQTGVIIALETVGANHCLDDAIDFFGDYNEYRRLFDTIKSDTEYSDYFACCIDTGHINLAVKHNQPTPADFIRKMGKNVVCLHLHDNNGYIDQHRTPGVVSIDFKDVFAALREIEYNGYYNAEVLHDFIGKDLLLDTARFTVRVLQFFINN